MSTVEKTEALTASWPDHTGLPERDGSISESFKELPQTILLTDSIRPVLKALHPDGQFTTGADSGIYWKFTDPPLRGCKAPDWFYIPGVPPYLDGVGRRSYVLWKEHVTPLIVLEYVSGDGSEERDATPETGKFWVYERAIRAKSYGIFEDEYARIEMYETVHGLYRRMTPNHRGRYPIPEMGVELGTWPSEFIGQPGPWDALVHPRWPDDPRRT